MNAIREDVEILVHEELDNANKLFPLFRSPHEGYAVIKEEIEEAEEQLTYSKQLLESLWTSIKVNNSRLPYSKMFCKDLKQRAIDGATELIQVAAMAQKYLDSIEG